MEILIERKWKRDGYTIGVLSIDGKRFCETLEDTDRGLRQDMSVQTLMKMKKPHVTAIPTGTYNVVINYSPRFKRLLPYVENVPAFSGIRIHPGNTAKDTDGCILVGENKQKGMVLNSRRWFNILFDKMTALKKNEEITLTIK